MLRLRPRARTGALALKATGMVAGVAATAIALGYLYDELTFLAAAGSVDAGDVVVILAALSLAFMGAALIAQLPESFWARFRRLPEAAGRKPVYGFGTMLSVGIGATLGSPLFILIPENITQYEVVSVVSLLLAAALSVAMAKVYSDMYAVSRRLDFEGVGGPSFTKLALGTHSVRYFVSRLSMWVSNTALAAYTEIVFLIFVLNPHYLPAILGSYGLSSWQGAFTYALAGGFVGWTILNVLFARRYLRLLGVIQVIMTAALVVILAFHSYILGATGGWNLSGLLHTSLGNGWVSALVINTGYLYLLFFGFQEIQSLQRDAVEKSSVPVLSWIRKGFTVSRMKYFGAAMVLSVVIAASVNILYGLAVFASHPAASGLQGSAIPALYLAQTILGPGQELLVAIAFLIATATTFVPAFLAASRHLGALGEDGYMPRSLANLSWVFTLVAILLLAIGNQQFLVNVTDFMVLVSLGIISLSAIWLRTRRALAQSLGRGVPLVVGLGCFVFGGAVYFVNPSVVIFGTIAVVFAYLIFDIIELGTLGAQMFLSVFGFVSLVMLSAVGHALYPGGLTRLVTLGVDPGTLLSWGLLLSSALLASNVLLDVMVLRRTSL